MLSKKQQLNTKKTFVAKENWRFQALNYTTKVHLVFRQVK